MNGSYTEVITSGKSGALNQTEKLTLELSKAALEELFPEPAGSFTKLASKPDAGLVEYVVSKALESVIKGEWDFFREDFVIPFKKALGAA